jgi:hypothetical protein
VSLSSDLSKRVSIESGEEVVVETWIALYGGGVGVAQWRGLRVYVSRKDLEPGWVSPLAKEKEEKEAKPKVPWGERRWGRKKKATEES